MIRKRLSGLHGPAWLVAFVLVVAAIACSLNPQPIPPLEASADGGTRTGGETEEDASMGTEPLVDAATVRDSGTDIQSSDGGDAGDAGDTGDASDAADGDAN